MAPMDEHVQPPVAPEPYPQAQTRVEKPGQVTAIAILTLISGIINCLTIFALFALWIPAIFALVVGIFELVYAAKILPDPIRTSKMNKTVAILQIVNVINCAGLGVVTGILALVFYNDPRVQAYYHEMARRGMPAS